MTPENIAMLQKTLGLEPTGVMDPKTLSAFQKAYDTNRTKTGLEAHAAREATADLQRTGKHKTREGVELSVPTDMPPASPVRASEGVFYEVVPTDLDQLEPDILGWYEPPIEPGKQPVPPEGGIPGMLERMKPEDRLRLLQKLSGVKR